MVSPIRRDRFTFHDDKFYVEVENCDHQRESASRLYFLLTYVAPIELALANTEGVPKPPKAHKDPPANFYRAQLLHYGLPELKTKAPAKKRLLAAFKDGSNGEKVLEVPGSILSMENEMREEWTKLNDAEVKMKGKGKETERDLAIAQNISRVEDGDSDNHVIETRTGLFSLERKIAERLVDDILHEHAEVERHLRRELEKLGVGIRNQLPKRKLQTDKESPGMYPPFPNYSNAVAGSSNPENLQAARKKTGPHATQVTELVGGNAPAAPRQAPRTKQTARKSTGGNPPWPKRGVGTSNPEVEPAQKKQKYGKRKILELCHGDFVVDVPQVVENWPDYLDGGMEQQVMEFSPSSTHSHLWGCFDLGIIYGYIRSVGPPPSRVGAKVNFIWRGRDRSEEQMMFGNKGYIIFSADGTVQGLLEGSFLGKATFTGYLESECSEERGKIEVNDWKSRWRSINNTAYEIENVKRWGKWVSDEGSIERPADSDTTDGGDLSDEDSECDY
ncbi:hypothetical protein BDQ17DRAFT_1359951 [Cyathus striatus]|nr:hypothetical protein BDQ17DRAFT_1359951 [Cyathus striatus]